MTDGEESAVGCGTTSAYQRHRRRGEEACDACKAALRTYQAEYRAANPNSRAKELRKSNARVRALWKLRLEYPQRFNELYAEELAEVGR